MKSKHSLQVCIPQVTASFLSAWSATDVDSSSPRAGYGSNSMNKPLYKNEFVYMWIYDRADWSMLFRFVTHKNKIQKSIQSVAYVFLSMHKVTTLM